MGVLKMKLDLLTQEDSVRPHVSQVIDQSLVQPQLIIRFMAAFYKSVPLEFDPQALAVVPEDFSFNKLVIPYDLVLNSKGELQTGYSEPILNYLKAYSSLIKKRICFKLSEQVSYYIEPSGNVELSSEAPSGGISVK